MEISARGLRYANGNTNRRRYSLEQTDPKIACPACFYGEIHGVGVLGQHVPDGLRLEEAPDRRTSKVFFVGGNSIPHQLVKQIVQHRRMVLDGIFDG